MWFEGVFGASAVVVGLLTGATYCFYAAAFLFGMAAMDAWYALRPPKKGQGLRQYAHDVFSGKIDPEKDNK